MFCEKKNSKFGSQKFPNFRKKTSKKQKVGKK